ncbi:hypothetical protein ACFPN2_26640 [Steroidobacter flavus]|uniref:Magnesium transporter MgtE intracellular domain-containing protein n=1 Tax=Steroidobacter flavus TaxID=1842136 RepID=A0ABV8SYI1_9GAMM
MKSQSELLGQLHRLNARDRAWIVEHLSEQERAQLMSSLAQPTPDITAMKLHAVEHHSSADSARTLGRVEPRIVAMITRTEPAWLNAVIVSEQEPTWSVAFLEALPATLRADVERMHPKEFGPALRESVTRLVLARCQGNVPVESAFERLVERLSSSRSRKRMTLHL